MKWLNQIKTVTDTETWKVGKFRITAAAAGRHQGHALTDKLPQDDGIVYGGGGGVNVGEDDSWAE